MNVARFICHIAGHTHRNAEYHNITPTGVDNVGRQHARLEAQCARCGQHYTIGYVHLPPRDHERALQLQIDKIREAL